MNVGDIRVQTSDGVFIPASVRADGSTRKAIRVKEGYIPQEEIGKYVIPAKRGVTATGIRPRQMANEEFHRMTPKNDEKGKESKPTQKLGGRKRTEPVINKFDDVSIRRSPQSPQRVPSSPPISPQAQVVPRCYKPPASWRNRKSFSSPPESPRVPPAQAVPSFYKPSDSWRYRKNSSSSSSQSSPPQSPFNDLPSLQSCDPNIDEISKSFSKKCHINPRK